MPSKEEFGVPWFVLLTCVWDIICFSVSMSVAMLPTLSSAHGVNVRMFVGLLLTAVIMAYFGSWALPLWFTTAV